MFTVVSTLNVQPCHTSYVYLQVFSILRMESCLLVYPFPQESRFTVVLGFHFVPSSSNSFFFLIFNFNPTPHVYVCVHKYHSMNVNVKRQLPGVCYFFHFTLSSGDQTLRSSNVHILTQMLSSAKPSCHP